MNKQTINDLILNSSPTDLQKCPAKTLFQNNHPNNISSLSTKDSSSDALMKRLIAYSNENGNLIEKFNQSFYLNYFDNAMIISASRELSPTQSINQCTFIKHFLLHIVHVPSQTIYLTMSLKQLFVRILQHSLKTSAILFSDFTSYLCNKIAKGDLDVVVPSLRVAKENSNPDLHRVRDIDVDPIYVVSKVQFEGPKMSKDGISKNRRLEHKKPVGGCVYAKNSILAIGTLSASIYEYDLDLNLKREIIPSACRDSNTSIAILSLAYCAKINRIGALVNNVGMIFWDEDFKIQKVIAKFQGDKIYYLDLSSQWVTTSTNAVHFWDIKQERISSSMHIANCQLLNTLCQVNHLRALCVSVTLTTGMKLALVYRDAKQLLRINLNNPGCHTLHYNLSTQSLLPVGYKNSVSVYRIEPRLLDVQMVGQLLGHTSLITCINSIKETGLIVTGDDIGEVRVWQINYLRCIQAVKVGKWLSSLCYLEQRLFFTDTRLNALRIDDFETGLREDLNAIYHFHMQDLMWVVTRKDIRKILLANGKTKEIFIICSNDEEVSCAVKTKAGIVVGTTRGEIIHFDEDVNVLWRVSSHEGDVLQLKYDEVNKFIISLGADGGIHVCEEINCSRIVKSISYKARAVNSLEICPASALLVVYSTEDKEVSLWDYELNKLSQVLECEYEIVCLKISAPLLVLATANGDIQLLTFKKKDKMEYQVLCSVHVSDALITSMCLSNYLLVGTAKGQLICYSLNQTLQNRGRREKKTNPNRQREYRDSYENGLKVCVRTQMATLQGEVNQFLNNSEDISVKQMWNITQHKQSINHIIVLQLECTTVTTICSDGYLKVHSIGTNKLLNSLNINHPLPVKWDTSCSNIGFIKKNLAESINIIDSIIQREGYTLLKKQLQCIQIKTFLKQIGNLQKDDGGKKQKKILIMRDQYTAEDYKGTACSEASLKALQAYKRVKLIKQANQKSFQLPEIYDVKAVVSNKEREYFAHILSPTHLPNIRQDVDLRKQLSKIFEKNKFIKQLKISPPSNRSSFVYLTDLKDVLKEKCGWNGANNAKQIVEQLDGQLKKSKKSRVKMP